MPYNAPNTYSSQGTTGYKSALAVGSPPVNVLEVKSFSNKPASTPEVDFTHLLSPAATREIKPGLIKPGTIKVGGNFIGDSTQLQFTTLSQAQTIFWFQVQAPVQNGSKTYTLSGYGYVADYSNGPFEDDKPIEFEVTIQLEGEYFETVA